MARSAGVTIAVGYDSGPPGTSAQEMIRLSHAGMNTIETIGAATIGAAAALGRDDLGSIKRGSLADIVIVASYPDQDLASLLKPEMINLVIKNGELIT